MRPIDIINKSDDKSKRRAEKQSITARLYKVEDNKILYTVNSAERDKQYTVTIQLLDLTGDKLKSLKSALNGNIKISCTCPAFLYQGYKYISYKKQFGINKETRPPDKTNPEQNGAACKHILVALEQMKSDYSEIYAKLKAQVPHGNSNVAKQQKLNIKDNNKSTEPTEYDITIVTDFKTACDKLYNSYQSYLKSNPSESDAFIDSKFYDGTDPSVMLQNLSKPVAKAITPKFIGKLKSLQDILKLIDLKKNGFNILLDSDIKGLIKKLNETISNKTEQLINDIIFNLMYS